MCNDDWMLDTITNSNIKLKNGNLAELGVEVLAGSSWRFIGSITFNFEHIVLDAKEILIL